jgi:hypothetical protein
VQQNSCLKILGQPGDVAAPRPLVEDRCGVSEYGEVCNKTPSAFAISVSLLSLLFIDGGLREMEMERCSLE